MHMVEFKVAGAQGDGLRDALSDQPRLDAREAAKRNRGTIMRVETLGFDHSLTDQAETALIFAL